MHRTKVRVVEDALFGNLVCPAEFRSGEDSRIMARSMTEREDEPLKYHHDAAVVRVSAKTGEGIDAFRAWLKELPARAAAEAAHDHDHEHHDHADHEAATA